MHLCTGSSPIKNLRRPPAGSAVPASLASIALILLAQLELGGSFRGLWGRSDATTSCAVESGIYRPQKRRNCCNNDSCGSQLRRGLCLLLSKVSPALEPKDLFWARGSDGGALRNGLCGFWRPKYQQEGASSASRASALGPLLRPKRHRQLPELLRASDSISRTLLRREIELPGRRGRESTPSAIC